MRGGGPGGSSRPASGPRPARTGTLPSYSQVPAPANATAAVKATRAPAPSSAGLTSPTEKSTEVAPRPSTQAWWAAAKPGGDPETNRAASSQSKAAQAPR